MRESTNISEVDDQNHLPSKNAVLHQGEEVLALIVALLSESPQKSKVQKGMALVTSSFLTLAKALVGTFLRKQGPDSVGKGLHPLAGLEDVVGILDRCGIIRENTDTMQASKLC